MKDKFCNFSKTFFMLRISFSICFFLCSFLFSQQLDLIPYPQKTEVKEGFFKINENTVVIGDEKSAEYQYFINLYNKIYNKDLSKNKKNENSNTISFLIQKPLKNNDLQYFDEDYQLTVQKDMIILVGKDSEGLFHGIQTLFQLIAASEDGKIPNLKIEDYPKFDYRGMHLDVARHFFTVDEVKKYLDYLAMYKYNKFHWHLTDDQGWRIEIKKYPKLTEIGAWRSGSQIGPYSDMKFDNKKYGGFYTQDQIKDIVNYAKKLHIDVIPEIEMPGHAVAAIASYPELSCLKGNFEISKKWGIEENILCPTEFTFEFLENVLDEVAALFPYEYIHIGGDEAPKKVWKESIFVQDLIRKLNLKDEHELQSYFIKRIEKHLNSKGKKIIGWEEILEGGLAPNATVMSWTGIEGGIHAAKSGHKAIMTPASSNYFDHYQGNPKTEPLAFGGNNRLDKVYSFNPIPSELSENEAQFIWGTQGNLWTEYILDFKGVEHMIFPRMMALSEVAWGTSKPQEYENFEKRVIKHFTILDKMTIHYSKAIFEDQKGK